MYAHFYREAERTLPELKFYTDDEIQRDKALRESSQSLTQFALKPDRKRLL